MEAVGAEPLKTALIDSSLTVLDRVFLIFIFVELLKTITGISTISEGTEG